MRIAYSSARDRIGKSWTPAAIISLTLLPVVNALAQTESGARPEIRLYAIDCGRMEINGVSAVASCFLIRHPKGNLLWDTGVPQTIADAPDRVTKIGGATVRVNHKLTDQLKVVQLAPADITYLAVSHTHFDHVGNAGLFASATWLVDTDERAWAFRDAARAAAGFSAYSALERAPTRLIEGDADYDVFGDGTVTIIQAPGHTPGHTVLLVRLAEAGPVLLAGDIWNTPDSQLQRRGTPEAQATLDKVERIVSANRARLIRQHIAADFDALPLYPGYLR